MKQLSVFLLVLLLTGVHLADAGPHLQGDSVLLDQAVAAFSKHDFDQAQKLTDQLIKKNIKEAKRKQRLHKRSKSSLDIIWISPETLDRHELGLPVNATKEEIISVGYKELNEVALALFIQAEIEREKKDFKKAARLYKRINKEFPSAYMRGYQGWFWKVAFFAQEAVNGLSSPFDYGNYEASELVEMAWKALHTNDMTKAEQYARKCIEVYDRPDSQFRKFVPVARYILGTVYKKSKPERAAREQFEKVVRDYPLTIYPNTKKYPYYNNITVKASDQLKYWQTSYDFGNYSSETLAVKSWKSWDVKDFKGVKLYAEKCIELFGQKAKWMQDQMQDFAPNGYIPFFGALNDVGTCYFILGMMHEEQQDYARARKMHETVLSDYGYAQCWNPKGFYWKVAEGSRKKLKVLSEAN